MTATTTGLAGFLTRVRGALADDARPDADLVRDYAAARSDDAFAELVRRFAPMVWGVCRRTVGDRHLAEDAFQAAFLVLFRKADAIRPPSAVGGWLHAVAVHTSLRARAMADRRRRRETSHSSKPDRPAPDPVEPTDPDLLRLLDAEIARLPDVLRSAVALCELDGVSRRDAAKRLGIAEGTLSSRLAAARKQLAARLRGRGVTLAAGLAGLAASGTAVAVPPVIPTPTVVVTALAEGAIRVMFLSKLKLMTAGLLAAVALLGVGLSAYPGEASEFRRTPPARRYAPVPVPKAKEGVILVGVNDAGKQRLEVLTPKGETVATLLLEPVAMYHPALSRDGKRVAVWAWDGMRTDGPLRVPPGQKISHKGTLLVFDIEKPEKPIATLPGYRSGGVVFAPDGKSLYLNEAPEPDPATKQEDISVHRFEVTTRKKVKLDLPDNHSVADVSADGKLLLTTRIVVNEKGEIHYTPHRVPLNTLKPEPIGKGSVSARQFSPDGRKILGVKHTDPKDHMKQELVILDVASGNESLVKLEKTYLLLAARWSPDGKKVLVNRLVLTGDPPPPQPVPAALPPGVPLMATPANEPELTIRYLDGSDPKPLLAELKGNFTLFGIDWK